MGDGGRNLESARRLDESIIVGFVGVVGVGDRNSTVGQDIVVQRLARVANGGEVIGMG